MDRVLVWIQAVILTARGYSFFKFHGSLETRLEAGLSTSVGTPPPFKDQGADAAPKAVGGE